MDGQTWKRISDLKKKLIETNDDALKYLDGELTEEEYLPIKTQRIAWRKEIKDLEEK